MCERDGIKPSCAPIVRKEEAVSPASHCGVAEADIGVAGQLLYMQKVLGPLPGSISPPGRAGKDP